MLDKNPSIKIIFTVNFLLDSVQTVILSLFCYLPNFMLESLQTNAQKIIQIKINNKQ